VDLRQLWGAFCKIEGVANIQLPLRPQGQLNRGDPFKESGVESARPKPKSWLQSQFRGGDFDSSPTVNFAEEIGEESKSSLRN
jgi:hypothetical protein